MGILYNRVQDITKKDVKTSDEGVKQRYAQLAGKELDGGMGILYNRVQDITKKDVKTSDEGVKQAENSENEDEESDDVQELNDPEEPSDPQSPIRGTEDDDGPDSEHCQEKPNHYIMILKPASKKKLCLFNIHHEYCINQQSTG
ncbi:hypothetical protein MSG28_015616 [Choristoneura fumiferana]|uniref:Uncharacterized protein n=1 Tax=Choristoneura fumiferana TaxID=7141 RepID=A0ACC0KBK7_CHOFU|nr:hypothetical protein MSG28_015616 [Choristoneura fumiferana]